MLRNAGIAVSDEEFDGAVRRCILSYQPGMRRPLVWHFTRPDTELYGRLVGETNWAGGPREIRPGIGELLEELSRTYTLALAANAGGWVRDLLEEHALLQLFTSTEVSGDLPYAKPDPRFFEQVLRNCNARPENAIMVGDRLDNDIIPAKLLGMKTILYRVGPYAILEPRTPDEIPDATVTSVPELRTALLEMLAG